MTISVTIPVYSEERDLRALRERLIPVLELLEQA